MSNPLPDSRTPEFVTSEFDQEGPRRSLMAPVLLALAVVLIAGAALVHYTYHKDFATGEVRATVVYPIHMGSTATMQVVGPGDDTLYLLPTLELHNHITLPLFIESLAVDMTAADGTTYHCTAAQLGDFAPMYANYPELARTVEATGDSPLQRDTRIEAGGGAAHGLIMVHFPITQGVWEQRKSASITVSFYHQQPLVIPFPAGQ
jgi:hypothetical protein